MDPDPRKEIEVDPDPDLDPERGLKWIRIRPNAVDPGVSGSETLPAGSIYCSAQTTPYFNKRTRHVRMDKVFDGSSYVPQVKPGLFSLEPPREGGNALRHPSRQIGPDSRPRHWPRPEDCNLEN